MSNSHSKPLPDLTPFEESYTLGPVLVNGTIPIHLCTEKAPLHNRYACKSIVPKGHDVSREIKVMHHLSDCPYVVRIKESFHEADEVRIVMELCEGGDLYDMVSKKGPYRELKAARILRTIVKVVMDCHSLGVLHRDVKPENFMFVCKCDDLELKAMDFRHSRFFKPGQLFSEVTSSPYYVAPEMLKKRYGPEADIWSAGVILYFLLSGDVPFNGESNKEIFSGILGGKLDFETQPWPTVSNSAKDLIRKMLNKNVQRRLTAHQVLCHEWMVNNGTAPERPLESFVLTRLRKFSGMNKLKKIATRYIAERLPEEETSGLREMFKIMDIDNSGEITLDKLKSGLNRLGSDQVEESEIKALMDAADTDGSGTIDCNEFITATFHMNKMQRTANLREAFEFFDWEGRGYITQHQIWEGCMEFGFTDDNLEDAFREIDQNNDGKIDHAEFVAMMKGARLWSLLELLQDGKIELDYDEFVA